MNHQPLTHLSASMLKTFVACPRKFFFNYIRRIEPAWRSGSLAFGSAWHSTLAFRLAAHREGKPAGLEQLKQHLTESIAEEIHSDDTPIVFDDDIEEHSLVELGHQMLEKFVAEVPLPEKVLDIEAPFSVRLTTDDGQELPPLVGGMDAVFEEAGRPLVVEFKTGKRRWPAEQIEYDLQLSAYAVGSQSLGYKDAAFELIVCTKAKTPQVQRERVTRTDRHRRDLMATALSVVKAAQAGVDYPNRGWMCRTCAFQGDCG